MAQVKYVVGFLTNPQGEVLLIRKNRPAWQAGRLNGIGGKVHEGELWVDAMTREFLEETGMFVPQVEWTEIGLFKGNDSFVVVFSAQADFTGADWQSTTDETVECHNLDDVIFGNQHTVRNLPVMLQIVKLMQVDPALKHVMFSYT